MGVAYVMQIAVSSQHIIAYPGTETVTPQLRAVTHYLFKVGIHRQLELIPAQGLTQ
jgi:hypothetical protein